MPAEKWLVPFTVRLFRSPTQRLARVLIVIAIMGVTVVAGLFASVRPSPEQRALWSTGAFEYAIEGGPSVRPGQGIPSDTGGALEATGATSWDYLLTTSVEFQGQSQPRGLYGQRCNSDQGGTR